jgi:hypothetical protein
LKPTFPTSTSICHASQTAFPSEYAATFAKLVAFAVFAELAASVGPADFAFWDIAEDPNRVRQIDIKTTEITLLITNYSCAFLNKIGGNAVEAVKFTTF